MADQDLPPRSRSTSKRPSKELEQESGDDNDNNTRKRRRGRSDDTDDEKGTGGLSDHSERDGAEREFAKESPPKGKKRVNSRVSVVIPC